MIAARRFGFLHPVHTTNDIAAIDDEACDGCGRCARACPVEAIEMIPDERPGSATGKRARRDGELCLGCGVCIATCTRDALAMEERPERVFTPVNSVHRTVLMAIERGTLQDLVFDNQAHLSHRAMAAVLGAILKLGPVKRALASQQLRSPLSRGPEPAVLRGGYSARTAQGAMRVARRAGNAQARRATTTRTSTAAPITAGSRDRTP